MERCSSPDQKHSPPLFPALPSSLCATPLPSHPSTQSPNCTTTHQHDNTATRPYSQPTTQPPNHPAIPLPPTPATQPPIHTATQPAQPSRSIPALPALAHISPSHPGPTHPSSSQPGPARPPLCAQPTGADIGLILDRNWTAIEPQIGIVPCFTSLSWCTCNVGCTHFP